MRNRSKGYRRCSVLYLSIQPELYGYLLQRSRVIIRVLVRCQELQGFSRSVDVGQNCSRYAPGKLCLPLTSIQVSDLDSIQLGLRKEDIIIGQSHTGSRQSHIESHPAPQRSDRVPSSVSFYARRAFRGLDKEMIFLFFKRHLTRA